ncbi:MAG: hypothetical protein Q8N12_05750 [Thermodesulfovibrionales bacterium]|nr:hypothetical protein [Nitrospinota bacterium]MDP3048921.1 hypothetical protein [Thermodesulfovibrionales bacterium]
MTDSEVIMDLSKMLMAGKIDPFKPDIKKLPDYIMNKLCESQDNEPSQDLVEAVVLLLGARECIINETNSIKLSEKEVAEAVSAFRIACGLERLRRVGQLKDVVFVDPLDRNARVKVEVPDRVKQAFNSTN